MIIPLTLDTIKQFYGAHQMRTVRGYAVTDGDSIEIVFGIYLDSDYWVLFADMSERMRKLIHTMRVKRIIVRCAKMLRNLLLSVHIPVVVAADNNFENASAMLEHFGYEKLSEEVYICQA